MNEPVAPPAGGRLLSPQFVAVTVATLAYFLALGVAVPTIPRFVKDGLGGSNAAVGLAVAAYGVAAVLCRPFLTWFVERYGRRLMFVTGSALAALGFLAQAAAQSFGPTIALRAVQGVAEAMLFVAAATMVNDLAPAHRRAEAASYFSVAVFVGIGIGPLLGEYLASDGRWTAAFLLSAAFTAASFVLGLLFVHPPPAPAPPPRVGRPPVLHKGGLATGAVLAIAMVGWASWATFLPLRADEVGASAGAMFGLYSLMVLALRLVGAKVPERVGLGRCTSASLVGIAVGLSLMALLPGAFGLWVGTATLSFGLAFMYPSLMAITVNAVDASERAAVVSTFTMFFEVGSAVGGIALGLVATITGYRGAFAAGAAVVVVGQWVLWRLVLVPRRAATPAPVLVPTEP